MLAAARCNLFSYSLASYQTNWLALNQKNQEVLEIHIKLIEKEPKKHHFGILKDLGQEIDATEKTTEEEAKYEANDKDQRLFFGDEFSDNVPSEMKSEDRNSDVVTKENDESEKLIDYDFDEFMSSSNILLPSQLLMDDSLIGNSSNDDLLDSLVPSQAEKAQNNADTNNSIQLNKNPSKKSSEFSKWFNLFSDLDPLNQQTEQDVASKNLHAA